MKKKIFTLLFSATMITFSASSQTINENIDKLAKDKETKERAAKADVFIHKKIIYDSTQTKTVSGKVVSNTPVVIKTKYKTYKYKKKKKKTSK